MQKITVTASCLTRIGEAFLNSARSTRLSSLSRSSQLQERALLVLRQRGGRPGVDCIEEREQLEVLCQVHLRKYITSLSLGSHSAGSSQNTCTKSTHQQQPEFASRHVIVASATSSLTPSDRQGRMLPLFLPDAKYPTETQNQCSLPITVWAPFAA